MDPPVQDGRPGAREGQRELACEGAAFPRLDPEDELDLIATDYRFGVPLTYGIGRYQMKLAYLHIRAMSQPSFEQFEQDILVRVVRGKEIWRKIESWKMEYRDKDGNVLEMVKKSGR